MPDMPAPQRTPRMPERADQSQGPSQARPRSHLRQQSRESPRPHIDRRSSESDCSYNSGASSFDTSIRQPSIQSWTSPDTSNTTSDYPPTDTGLATQYIPPSSERQPVPSVDEPLSKTQSVTFPPTAEQGLAASLAQQISRDWEFDPAERETLRVRVNTALPDLLCEYASLLRRPSAPQREMLLVRFIEHHTELITQICVTLLSAKENSSSNPDWHERIHLLRSLESARGLGREENENISRDAQGDGSDFRLLFPSAEEQGDNLAVQNYHEYLEFFQTEGPWRWLLRAIRRCVNTTASAKSTDARMRAALLPAIRSLQAPTDKKGCQCHIIIDWDPKAFLRSEYGSTANANRLYNDIVICGEDSQLQAMTCNDYVQLMWPLVGETLLLAIGRLAISDSADPMIYESSNDKQTSWGFHLNSVAHTLHADIKGLQTEVLEIVETLVWLGAACRASPDENKITYCSPKVSMLDQVRGQIDDRHVRVEYTYTAVVESKMLPGQCWHDMVRNPTIAAGYPVTPRSHGQNCLEVSLDIMLVLSQATWATVFEAVFVLKGYYTMLVPILSADNAIVWHYIEGMEHDRLPYTAIDQCNSKATVADVDIRNMETRHFIGWTTNAKILADNDNLKYEKILTAESQLAGSSLGISGGALSGGMHITTSLNVVRGQRHVNERFDGQNSYCLLVENSRIWRMVFHDRKDERAWLLNGTAAIVFLVRTYLSQKPYLFGSSPEERKLKMSESQDPPSLLATLLDESNRGIRLSKNTDGSWYRLEHHVERMCEYLAKLQDITASRKLKGLKEVSKDDLAIWSTTLDGWEFEDVMLLRPNFYPHTIRICSNRWGWPALTKEVHCIHIFGRSLGHLIASEVPLECHMKDALVAPIQVLAEISRTFGCAEKPTWVPMATVDDPGDEETCSDLPRCIHLANDFYWVNPEGVFPTRDNCITDCPPHECKHVHAKLSSWHSLRPKMRKSMSRAMPEQICNGAIIFAGENLEAWAKRRSRSRAPAAGEGTTAVGRVQISRRGEVPRYTKPSLAPVESSIRRQRPSLLPDVERQTSRSTPRMSSDGCAKVQPETDITSPVNQSTTTARRTKPHQKVIGYMSSTTARASKVVQKLSWIKLFPTIRNKAGGHAQQEISQKQSGNHRPDSVEPDRKMKLDSKSTPDSMMSPGSMNSSTRPTIIESSTTHDCTKSLWSSPMAATRTTFTDSFTHDPRIESGQDNQQSPSVTEEQLSDKKQGKLPCRGATA